MLGLGKKEQPMQEKESVFAELGIAGNGTIPTDFSNNTEQAYAKLMDKLTYYDDEIIKLMSEMTPEQVMLCTNLLVQSNEFECPMVKEFVYTFMRNNVSKDRKGRGELVEIVRAAREADLKKTLLGKLHLAPRNQAL